MIKITMFSSAQKVAGQGVGSAYAELMRLLRTYLKNDFEVQVNHYHTIDPQFYLSTFLPNRGCKVGYVHFLPETLEGSLQIPKLFRQLVYKYVIAFYKRMDQIIVVNPSFIPKLTAYGIPKNRITYIPNFVSKTEFYPVTASERQKIRTQLGFQTQDFIVLGTDKYKNARGLMIFIN